MIVRVHVYVTSYSQKVIISTETAVMEYSLFLLVKFENVLMNVHHKQRVDLLSYLKITLR